MFIEGKELSPSSALNCKHKLISVIKGMFLKYNILQVIAYQGTFATKSLSSWNKMLPTTLSWSEIKPRQNYHGPNSSCRL